MMTNDQNKDAQITLPENEGITFTFEDEDGNEVECRVLYFFHSEHNDKHYMVYSTGVVGEDGEEVSAAKYDPDAMAAMAAGEDVDVALEPLTTDIEWAIVADTLKRVAPEGTDVDAADVASADVDLRVQEG